MSHFTGQLSSLSQELSRREMYLGIREYISRHHPGKTILHFFREKPGKNKMPLDGGDLTTEVPENASWVRLG